MGYSARADAFRTLSAISDICFEQTDCSNKFKTPRGTYFYERGNENGDGAITGSIYRFTGEGSNCRKCGGFRIEPDGAVSRGPAFFKKAAQAK